MEVPSVEKKWGSRAQAIENPPVIEGRVPPHDLDAEAAVLSACMLDPSAMDKITDLKHEYFYSESHRRIFEACFDKIAAHPYFQRIRITQRNNQTIGRLKASIKA